MNTLLLSHDMSKTFYPSLMGVIICKYFAMSLLSITTLTSFVFKQLILAPKIIFIFLQKRVTLCKGVVSCEEKIRAKLEVGLCKHKENGPCNIYIYMLLHRWLAPDAVFLDKTAQMTGTWCCFLRQKSTDEKSENTTVKQLFFCFSHPRPREVKVFCAADALKMLKHMHYIIRWTSGLTEGL